jgi:putative flippase GtrA
MQFLLYLIVGGLSFLVDIGTFVALRRATMPVIPASVASFIVATVANYLLSILLAFERGRFSRHVELMRFLSVVLVGLALNTGLVWCFVYSLAIHPTVAKIAAVPIVLIWNYLGRRALVFDDRIPASIVLQCRIGTLAVDQRVGRHRGGAAGEMAAPAAMFRTGAAQFRRIATQGIADDPICSVRQDKPLGRGPARIVPRPIANRNFPLADFFK